MKGKDHILTACIGNTSGMFNTRGGWQQAAVDCEIRRWYVSLTWW